MSSLIIGDDRYQELNMSFTFDQPNQHKLVVNVQANHNFYRLEHHSDSDLEFDDLKSALLLKQFKLTQISTDSMKIKIYGTYLVFKQFKQLTYNTFDALNFTISELNNKLKEQSQKNNLLQVTVKQMKVLCDESTIKIADCARSNNEKNQQILKLSRQLAETRQRQNQQAAKMILLEKSLNEQKNQLYSLSKDFSIKSEKKQNKASKQSTSTKENLNGQKKKDQQSSCIEKTMAIVFSIIFVLVIFVMISNPKLRFSFQHKANNITLTNNNYTVTNHNENSTYSLALVDGSVLKNGSSIRFKIQSIKAYVFVGLAVKNIIAVNSYDFKNLQEIGVGDGLYAVSFRGWSFSHSESNQNFVWTGFEYQQGDVIKVQTRVDKLLFLNERTKDELTLKIRLTQEEWKQAYFFVQLHRFGDSVSIL